MGNNEFSRCNTREEANHFRKIESRFTKEIKAKARPDGRYPRNVGESHQSDGKPHRF